ncbi:MAG TPA: hypothetical protein VLY63_23300 [Anaerolineae bacterium]|nr:hypothetical protein [Anaerolineae bacterium]
MTVRSPWLRIVAAALAILGLVVVMLLILQFVPIEARSQDPAEQPVATGITAPAAVGTRALTITVEATSTIVVPGQMVTYTIEFHHVGGTAPLQGQLFNPFAAYPGPGLAVFTSAIGPHVDGLLVQATGSVTPTTAQVVWTPLPDAEVVWTPLPDAVSVLHWKGSLGPDSGLRIRYAAEVKPCFDPDLATIRNTVTVQGDGGGTLTDSVDLQVDCLPAVDPANVNVQYDFFWGSETVNELVPGRPGIFQVELTNSDLHPTTLGLVGIFPSRSFNIGMPPSIIANVWRGGSGLLRETEATTQTLAFLVSLAPGETQTLSLPIRLREEVPPESEFEIKLGYCITYDGLFCPGTDPQSKTPPPSLQWLPPSTFTVRFRDLGDAPDSTSHHATLMPAYGGVQANFPTVYDPVTGPEQGPAHLNPRPFHLGRRVSPEAEADIGPDLDPTNNILPLANIPNRDRRDDGLALKLLNFSPCQASRIPIRIVVRSAAVAYFSNTSSKGYLNVWLDGNHDGDWADSFSCPGEQTAVEQIVIDHPIDVANLGPGVHTLAVPTGLVPWSGQGAWLRATLSEKPSNKTLNAGGIDYGDGRGHGTPFLLGETEDYFLRPPGTPGAGPDMGLDLFAGWRPLAPASEGASSEASPNLEIHLTASYFMAEYRNEGSETAEDVVLTHLVPPALQNLEPYIVGMPTLGDGVVVKVPGRIEISLGDVDPGTGGSIVLGFTCCPCLTCTRSVDYSQGNTFTGTTTIESSHDINPANDSADSSVEIPELIEVGFTSPRGSYLRTSGVTSHNDVVLRGRTSPDTLLEILAEGQDGSWASWVLSADGSGTFEQTINLANGRYRIFVFPQDTPGAFGGDVRSGSPQSVGIVKRIDKATPLLIAVNNHLPWNPSSLTFTDSEGRSIQPMPLGFENQAGWFGHLKAGETYRLSMEYEKSAPKVVIQAHFLGQTIPLADPDGDGVYIAEIPKLPPDLLDAQAPLATSAPLTISIASGNVETVFGGTIQVTPEGVVYDAGSGQPLSASVTLLQAFDADPEDGFDVWTGAAYGQANPQPTGGDGSYAFWPEAGTYYLEASRAGYQPYRSWNVQTTGEPVNADVPLTPEIAGEPDYVVEVGPDGFEPSVLTVLPGSIVKWVNMDIADHTSTSIDPRLARPGVAGNGGWDSGRLSSGESYMQRLVDEGTFTYADRANPANTAHIQVGGDRVYLPLITRQYK